MVRAYGNHRVPGGDGEDVGAGDGLLAEGLQLRLDAVDDLEASKRFDVGESILLVAGQQNGRVTTL
jgi:hypothetical protein